MNPEAIKELKEMIENLTNLVGENQDTLDKIWALLAKNNASYYKSLVAEGFTADQAIALITASLAVLRRN